MCFLVVHDYRMNVTGRASTARSVGSSTHTYALILEVQSICRPSSITACSDHWPPLTNRKPRHATHALAVIDHHLEDYIARARLKRAACEHDSFVQNPGLNALVADLVIPRSGPLNHTATD